MRHGSFHADCGFRRQQPDGHGCCRPCCGYIVEEIHSHQQECCCFQGILEICGLPARLVPPLTLCSVDVVCISPQCAGDRHTFRLTLRCEVADCRGCRANGEAFMSVAPGHVPDCCNGNLHLGAEIDVREARFCAPSGFAVCADVCLTVVITGAGRMLRQQPRAPKCLFPPLYPAPACVGRGRNTDYF